jgi:hypothetical protein
MAERRQLRVSGGPEGRSERPATGLGRPEPTLGVAVLVSAFRRLEGRAAYPTETSNWVT